MPLLLAEPGPRTTSVAMFDLRSNVRGGEVAALMTLFASAFYLMMRRQSAKTFGH